MLLSIGTRVKFRHTGEEGVVSAILADGMVEVYLEEDDMEIPAFPEDLLPATPRLVQLSKPEPAKAPEPPPPATQYAILKSLGIQLAFVPENNPDGTVKQYEVFLINDTPSAVIHAWAFNLKDQPRDRGHGRLEPLSFQSLGFLLFDQLNDAPSYEIECWKITTQGTGPKLFRNLRIKPQQFFKNTRVAPLLNRQAQWYRIFETLDSSEAPQAKKEDLRDYAKSHAPRSSRNEDAYGDWRDTLPGVREYAEFVNEIDLHIEKLTERHAKLSNAEILRIQMAHFDAFMSKAIRLGVASVFIIHGVGKGVLREAVAQRLKGYPDVRNFFNEYHPKYGWGATEVLFE
jgi:hypothetical protein